MKGEIIAGVLLTMVAAGHAQAEEGGLKLGLGAGVMSIGDSSIKANLLNASIGYAMPMGETFYSEIQSKFGFTSVGEITEGGFTTQASADSIVSGYYKFGVKAAPKLLIYGLAGYAKVKYKVTVSPVTATAEKSGTSFGAGVSYAVSDSKMLGIEYIDYPSNSKVSSIGLAASWSF